MPNPTIPPSPRERRKLATPAPLQRCRLARPRELQGKAENLALASRYDPRFLANMSHELRTPLNSLLLLSRQLAGNKQGNLSAQQVEYAETIYQAGTDLLELINEMLDFAKIEAGKLVLHLAPVNLRALQRYIARIFDQVAAERGLAFWIEAATDLPPAIVTDEMRLKQVLRNLLANAFKFTDAGSVTFRISLAGDGHIVFAVQDTGLGITAEQQQVIFEAFQQLDSGTHRKYGGTGLGLAISRDLATLLRGNILVDSTPGVGSTFALRVPRHLSEPGGPVAAVEAHAAPYMLPPISALRDVKPPVRRSRDHRARADTAVTATRSGPEPALIGKQVLIVDDDLRNVFALTALLEEHGMTVSFAENGREALARLRSDTPVHLVLMDVMMPEMDGIEAIRALRACPNLAELPVIAVTARAMPGDRRACLNAGACAYLAKPVIADELLASLRTWLGDRRAQD